MSHLIVTFLITSCGGGDSASSNGISFTLSTSTINFVSETPSVKAEAQSLTGTVSGSPSGTLYILISATGNAVSSFSNVVINNTTQSGTASVFPGNAQTLGAGTHTSTITVKACLNDITCATGELSGSPRTVQVNYLIKPSVQAESIMPHTGKANTPDDIIIRGFNFITDQVNKVSFSGIDASQLSVISETEIHATYPALASGSYSVQLSNLSGPTSFTSNIVIVDTPSFSAQAIEYSPHQTLKALYDDDREALFIAASYFDGSNFNTYSRQSNKILRYQFSEGALVSMEQKTIPLLQGMAFSPDENNLIAITDTEILQLDSTTLSQINVAPINTPFFANQYFKDIVVTNDNLALITTGYMGSGNTPTYLYSIPKQALYPSNHTCTYFSSPGVSADGSSAAFIQGSLSPSQPLCNYLSTMGAFTETSLSINQKQCTNSFMGLCLYPVVDKTGRRIAITDNTISVNIYDSSFNLLGKLPVSSKAVVFNSDGSRIYAYDSANLLRTYDLTMNTVDGLFQEIGSGTILANSPGTGVLKIILSSDDSTLFIAGSDRLIIQPAP